MRFYCHVTVLLLACAPLSSCITPSDARNPTVEEMDALDMQWGLAARKSKGNPRRYSDSTERVVPSQSSAPAVPASPAAPSAPRMDPEPPAVPAGN